MAANVTKVTLNLPSNLLDRVKQSAHDRGVSVTEAFRGSLETDLFLREAESAGGKVLIEKRDGKMLQILRHF